jgi:hypothetical protein
MSASILPQALETLRAISKFVSRDHRVEQIARIDYPETKLLQQVSGVGPLIALTFVADGGRQN